MVLKVWITQNRLIQMKLTRGKKLCPSCNAINGARRYECEECDYVFKARPVTDELKWYELKQGDQIKVYQGSGPYYINSNNERVYLTDSGPYIVEGLDEFGIRAFGIGKSNYGFSYLYMGPECKSPLINSIMRSPHKISKINVSRKDIGFFMNKK